MQKFKRLKSQDHRFIQLTEWVLNCDEKVESWRKWRIAIWVSDSATFPPVKIKPQPSQGTLGQHTIKSTPCKSHCGDHYHAQSPFISQDDATKRNLSCQMITAVFLWHCHTMHIKHIPPAKVYIHFIYKTTHIYGNVLGTHTVTLWPFPFEHTLSKGSCHYLPHVATFKTNMVGIKGNLLSRWDIRDLRAWSE